jgi:hypothetical protein
MVSLREERESVSASQAGEAGTTTISARLDHQEISPLDEAIAQYVRRFFPRVHAMGGELPQPVKSRMT